jgi:hypothetical protein
LEVMICRSRSRPKKYSASVSEYGTSPTYGEGRSSAGAAAGWAVAGAVSAATAAEGAVAGDAGAAGEVLATAGGTGPSTGSGNQGRASDRQLLDG